MKNLQKFYRNGAIVVGVLGASVVSSPVFALASGATTAIEGAKAAGETVAPLIVGAVAVIVGVSLIVSMLRKA